ncbi:hypothetical protein ACHAO1_008547 [Botrytis cinerea]
MGLRKVERSLEVQEERERRWKTMGATLLPSYRAIHVSTCYLLTRGTSREQLWNVPILPSRPIKDDGMLTGDEKCPESREIRMTFEFGGE